MPLTLSRATTIVPSLQTYTLSNDEPIRMGMPNDLERFTRAAEYCIVSLTGYLYYEEICFSQIINKDT